MSTRQPPPGQVRAQHPLPISDEIPAATYRGLLGRFILEGKLDRSTVGRILQRSPGAVTKHVRLLVDHGLLIKTPVRVAHAKRPMDELALRPDAATGLAILLTNRRAVGELIGLDLKPIYRSEIEIGKPTQSQVLSTLSRLVADATAAAREFGRNIDFLGIGTEGLVLPGPAIIFSMVGISKWDPCQPAAILAPLTAIGNARVWTMAECKVYGFARELHESDRLAYLEIYGDHIALSTMKDGNVILGEHGTSSAYLHIKVSDDTARCFCGRTGCFHHHLRTGQLDAKIMQTGLKKVFEQISAAKMAIELHSSVPQSIREQIRSVARRFQIVPDGDTFAREGVRVLTAQECAWQLLHRTIED